MTVPITFPGPTLQRLDRPTRAWFRWRAQEQRLTAMQLEQLALFDRAAGPADGSDATSFDSSGALVRHAAAAVRFDAWDVDKDGVAELLPMLLEPADTNRVPYSEDYTQWTQTNSPTVTLNALTLGRLPIARIADDSGSVVEEVVRSGFTLGGGTGEKGISFVIGQDASASAAGGSRVALRDTSASALRFDVTITWSAGVPAFTVNTGTVLYTRRLGVRRGVTLWRVYARTTSATASNTHSLTISPAGTAAQQGALYIGGVMVGDLATPTSYIKTGAAAVSRAADSLYWTYLASPGMTSTLYLRMIEVGSRYLTGTLLDWGGATAPRMILDNVAGGPYRGLAHNGAASTTASVTGTPAVGSIVELRAVLTVPSGAVTVEQAENGVATAVGGPSTALAAGMATALYQARLTPATGLPLALLDVIHAPGARSFTALRGML